MHKVILLSPKCNEKIKIAEKEVLEHLCMSNKSKVSLETIATVPTNNSILFKQYPVMYIDGRILDTKSIIPFVYELLFPDTKNASHFHFLMMFLYNEFRYLYQDAINGLKSIQNATHVKREIDITKAIDEFIQIFSQTQEENFVYTVISLFINEYKIIFNIPIKTRFDITNFHTEEKTFVITEEQEKKIPEILLRHSIRLNKEDEKIIPKELEEIQVQRNWRSNIFSLGLFLTFTGVLYVISVVKK